LNDDTIHSKLAAGSAGSKTIGAWFTPAECRRLGEMVGAGAKVAAPAPMPAPLASVVVIEGPAFTVKLARAFTLEPGMVLDLYPRLGVQS
jgi:hypothetical protein